MTQSPHEYVPDWMLMAYADGELPPEERTVVEACVASDEDAAQRLAAFVRSGRALGQIFDTPMHEPPPARLVDTVRLAYRPRPAVSEKLVRLLTASGWMPPLPYAAASAALAVALGTVLAWNAADAPDISRADPVLALALETLPSAPRPPATPGPGRAAVTPTLSFASASGEFCRQYARTGEGGRQSAGVGCRLADGGWRIEVEVPADGPHGDPGVVMPAAGPAAPAIAEVVDRLIKGDALSRADEEQLLKAHWRTSP